MKHYGRDGPICYDCHFDEINKTQLPQNKLSTFLFVTNEDKVEAICDQSNQESFSILNKIFFFNIIVNKSCTKS